MSAAGRLGYDAAMPDFFAVHASRTPDRPAVIWEGRTLTFAQLDARANRFANLLTEIGVAAGDRVAAMGFNSLARFEMGGGVLKKKAVSVPVNYRLKAPEVAHVLSDSGARVVFADPAHAPVVEAALETLSSAIPRVLLPDASGQASRTGWVAYEELMAKASDTPVLDDNPLTASPSMIYTGGTTGKPKGVFRPEGARPDVVMAVIQSFTFTPDDVHLVAGPLYHSAPAAFSGMASLLGATQVVESKFDAVEALELIQRHRVTTTYMAPTLIMRLCDVIEANPGHYDTSSMRVLVVGAAPCPFALKQRVDRLLGPVLWEFYGATETNFNTLLRPEDQLRKPGSCGRPFPHVEIKLLDDDGREVPDYVPGTLYIRKVENAFYHNRPEAEAAASRDGFFTVGDVAYRDHEGFLYICDRKIDMIISGGANIYPAEVEAVLFEHPAVAECAVIGVPNYEFGEEVLALVALKPGAAATEEELIQHCRDRIADYKRPRRIEFRPELPRGSDGKMHKRSLREPYWEGRQLKL